MILFTVNAYSHHFAVSNFNRDGKRCLLSFAEEFAEYKYTRRWTGEVIRELARYYASATKDRLEFRFHISTLESFLDHLYRWGYPKEQIEVITHGLYEPVKCEIKIKEGFKALPYQHDFINHLVSEGGHSRVITLQTGKGKTFCALAAAQILGVRTVVVIKGMYVDRWMQDLVGEASVLDTIVDDVMVVRGSRDLKALIELAQMGELDVKIIVITNTTMRAFYDQYEGYNRDRELYGCYPYEFYETLQVGLRIIDEVHQDFHMNFRQDLHSHIPRTISLSATLESDNEFINRMYKVMFPPITQIDGGVYHKYIECTALFYGLRNPDMVRYTSKGRHTYNHIAFEESIMRSKRMTDTYLEMIRSVVEERYATVFEAGQKMLIFAGSVEMCTVITDYLKDKYRELIVSKYTAEDEYDTLLNSDITVSTLLSAGTAVDVPGLRVCLVTTAIGSTQANLQALGRLRELKRWPGTAPEFLYFVCTDIRSHVDYHNRKKERFRGKVVSHKTVFLGMNL